MTEITFENYDKFERKALAYRLTKAITTFHQFSDGAYVLSLNAKFGSGKTTFLKMWQHELSKKGFSVVYLNAWETDFDEDPIIPITSSLIDNIKVGEGSQKAKSALRGALGATAIVGNKFLEQATGIDVYKTMKGVESDLKESDLKEIGKGLYKNYNFKLNAYRQLKEKLSTYVESLVHKPLIVLVDELDRVRPDYSVKFLEAIKHIFPIKGICFVLAVDREQLECSVKQLYGNLDFDNYYRRFITREIQLTSNKNPDLNRFIEQLGEEYFDAKILAGINFCFENQGRNNLLGNIASISKIFSLTPRQIQELFRILVHFIAVDDSKQRAADNWLGATVLLIAIGIKQQKIYHKIGLAQIKANELHEYLLSLNYSGTSDRKRYIVFSAIAFNLHADNEENKQQSADIVVEYDNKTLQEDDKPNARRQAIDMLARSVDRFGTIESKSGFQIIYERLEDWRSFID